MAVEALLLVNPSRKKAIKRRVPRPARNAAGRFLPRRAVRLPSRRTKSVSVKATKLKSKTRANPAAQINLVKSAARQAARQVARETIAKLHKESNMARRARRRYVRRHRRTAARSAARTYRRTYRRSYRRAARRNPAAPPVIVVGAPNPGRRYARRYRRRANPRTYLAAPQKMTSGGLYKRHRRRALSGAALASLFASASRRRRRKSRKSAPTRRKSHRRRAARKTRTRTVVKVIRVRASRVRRARVRRARVKSASITRYAGRPLHPALHRRGYIRRGYIRRGFQRRGYLRHLPLHRNPFIASRNPFGGGGVVDTVVIPVATTTAGFFAARVVGNLLQKALEGRGPAFLADNAKVGGAGISLAAAFFLTRGPKLSRFRPWLIAGSGIALVDALLKRFGILPDVLGEDVQEIDVSHEGAPYRDTDVSGMGDYVTGVGAEDLAPNEARLLGMGEDGDPAMLGAGGLAEVDQLIDEAESAAGTGAYVTDRVSGMGAITQAAAGLDGRITQAAAGMDDYVTGVDGLDAYVVQ